GQQSKIVYLPEGDWYYYFNNNIFQGGQEHNIETPLDEMPIFVKAGSVIAEYPVMQHTGEKKIEELLLNVYFGKGINKSYLYTDHGDTFAYEQDVYLEKCFITSGTDHSLDIKQQLKGLFTERYEEYDLKLIQLPFDIQKVLVDGKEIGYQKDESGYYRVRVSKDFEDILIQG